MAASNVFPWLSSKTSRVGQPQSNIEQNELYRTFNCGVGMVLAVAQQKADIAIEFLQQQGLKAWQIGEITEGVKGVDLIP